jgi:phosphoenolpyruvate-protein kinase (PTS system EI component)
MTRQNNDFISRRTASQAWRRNQNTVAFEYQAKLGPVSHTIIIAMMVAVLGMIYLTQITKTSTYGYQIDTLNTRQSALIAKKSELEVESARLKSLQKIQSSEVAKNLTSPASTEYVN